MSSVWTTSEKYVDVVLDSRNEKIREKVKKERGKMKKLLVLVSLVCIMLGMGCVAASQVLTYANLDQDAVDYAVDAGVAEVRC